MTQWMPQIDRDKCIGCGKCVALCPTHALERVMEKAMLTRPDLCTYCTACEDVCPVGAIELPFLIVAYAANEET
jgi:ferredoxin